MTITSTNLSPGQTLRHQYEISVFVDVGHFLRIHENRGKTALKRWKSLDHVIRNVSAKSSTRLGNRKAFYFVLSMAQ